MTRHVEMTVVLLWEKVKKKMKVLVLQSSPTLCNPTDCSPPGSTVHGILEARILEWVAISFSRRLIPTQGSNPCLLCLLHRRWILYRWATEALREAELTKICNTENQRRLGGSTTLEVKDSRKIWWDRERQPPSQQCLDTVLKADKRTQVTEFLL